MRILRRAAALIALVLVFCATSGAALAQDGRWLRAETPNFVFYGDTGEATLRANITQLERFDAWLRFLLNTHTPSTSRKLEVYLFRSERGLDEVYPGIGSSVRGFYTATPEETVAFALLHTSGMEGPTVLFHEYAHHFMLQYFAGAYPKWFVEGFAEFVATTQFDGDQVWVGASLEGRRAALENAPWVSMDRMLTGEDLHGADFAQFYGQAWLMTNYILLNSDRKAQFSRYLALLRSGAAPVAAFPQAFGETPAQFENHLRSYLVSGVARHGVRMPQGAALEIQVQRLPQYADDLLPIVARLRRAPTKPEERAELVRDALAAAARYPDVAMAQRVHARALLLSGDRAGARALLEPIIAANASDTEALYLMGKSYLDEAQAGPPETSVATASQGRRYFARVFRLDPHDAGTLFAYTQTFGHPLDDATLEVLLEAHGLAPQVDEISVYAGTALMETGHGADAVSMLGAVAYSPHGGRLRKRALHLLEAAQRGEQPPPPSPQDEADEDED